jgi:predicted transcriptional regulator
MEADVSNQLTDLTADIVATYVAHNMVTPVQLQALIQDVYGALKGLSTLSVQDAQAETVAATKPTAAQIRKSITPEAIVSFIDGKPYKMLKRHLTNQGFTPDTYRSTFGLPADYPITASNYSAARSKLAKNIGLGAMGRKSSKAR